MKKMDKRNMPVSLIVLSLIFLFPLGVYFLVLKTDNSLKNVKRVAKYLNILGFLVLTVGLLYFFINYDFYVSLIDSHMSSDMYNFSFIYIYFYLLMLTISCIVGGVYLNRRCDDLVIYTEFINIRHIKDIRMIAEETMEDVERVKTNIKSLIDKEHLINIKLVDDHVVSTRTVDKSLGNTLVRCRSCGNIKRLDGKHTYCDFCDRELIKSDKI